MDRPGCSLAAGIGAALSVASRALPYPSGRALWWRRLARGERYASQFALVADCGRGETGGQGAKGDEGDTGPTGKAEHEAQWELAARGRCQDSPAVDGVGCAEAMRV